MNFCKVMDLTNFQRHSSGLQFVNFDNREICFLFKKKFDILKKNTSFFPVFQDRESLKVFYKRYAGM